MDRIDRMLKQDLFLYHLEQNNAAEADRRFCRHNLSHFLDVARIGRILNLEENLGIPADWIYAAALLHDLGRHIQYEDQTPHALASGKIAPEILADCGFEEEETRVITDAILHHGDSGIAKERSLRGVLYRADKASRPCFACEAERDCNWKGEKKNRRLRY